MQLNLCTFQGISVSCYVIKKRRRRKWNLKNQRCLFILLLFFQCLHCYCWGLPMCLPLLMLCFCPPCLCHVSPSYLFSTLWRTECLGFTSSHFYFPLQEVEREISFRTECGLYYSYYKQMLQAPSIQQGKHCIVVPISSLPFITKSVKMKNAVKVVFASMPG